MTAWDYKSLLVTMLGTKPVCYEDGKEVPISSPDMFPRVKALGEQGWEMAGASSWATPHVGGGSTIQWIYWFKRPKG